MITVELTTFQAIVARSEIAARLPENRKFRDEAPGFARKMCDQHVEAMEETIVKLNKLLAERGIEPEPI